MPPSLFRLAPALFVAGLLTACSGHRSQSAGTPRPAGTGTPARAPAETVIVRDPQLEERAARLELRLLEKDGQIEELQTRLEDARREVVRSMAKLQSLATRAEAASGMAEAELALQSLRTAAGSQSGAPEIAQSARLLQMGAAEFDRENYGGALYLANQAKDVAGTGRGRLLGVDRGALRAGEVPFALPLRLQASGRSNVREGPGPGFRVVYTISAGMPLTAYSFVADWVRITDDSSRTGWIHQSRIARRP